MPSAAEVLDSFLLKLDYKIELSPQALKSMEFATYHDFDFLHRIPLQPLELEQADYFKVGKFSELGFWRVERIIENRLSFIVHIRPRGNFIIYDARYVEGDSLVPLKGLIFKEAGRDEILFFSSMDRLSSSRAPRFLIRTIEKLDSRLEVLQRFELSMEEGLGQIISGYTVYQENACQSYTLKEPIVLNSATKGEELLSLFDSLNQENLSYLSSSERPTYEARPRQPVWARPTNFYNCW